eukprot:10034733-Ditylum_brightwellii.AAC.1
MKFEKYSNDKRKWKNTSIAIVGSNSSAIERGDFCSLLSSFMSLLSSWSSSKVEGPFIVSQESLQKNV